MILVTPLGEVETHRHVFDNDFVAFVFDEKVDPFHTESEANAAALAFAKKRAAEILADAQTTLKMLEEMK